MIQQFQQFFNNDYTDFSSFLNKVLFPIFGENNFEKGYDVLTQDSEIEQKAAEANIIEIKHIGTFSTDLAADIKLFEVVLSDNSRIERSRINIQQLIRRYVETFEGAFMVFHYQNPENRSWRFSYVEKRSSLTDSTSAKRYTYLFGKDYACRTAAQRFNDLYKLQQNITLQDITTAFSVEALSDEFFERYRNIYADFIQFISGKRFEKEKGKWVEKEKQAPDPQFQTAFAGNDKAVRDYVKKMLGRLVFLQFLQKKGWMGVPVDKSWGEGDNNYMQKLFATSNHKENFLEAVLEPLFFDTLNHERDNQIADSSLGENIKIPYLNGGLFEQDELDKKTVVFPANYFKQLFDFFGEYNFTIDENDPNDAELGVDPEMLGRIFENLLEDNKDKGAFYTPKEIVQYMCRESLIAYLTTGNETNEESIKELVIHHKADSLSETQKEVLDQKLKDLKVCDPAIGSGAFPMGMMNEIFKCRIAIEGITDNAANIKKHIIQNNIYGVDIENGAVDIARLRFWLALVVDETDPQPLPNLDYKIMQGNSLLESFEGHDLSRIIKTPETNSNNLKGKKAKNQTEQIECTQLSMGFDADQTQANLNILIRDYFQIKNSEEKHLKAGMINTQIKEHIKTCAGHTPAMNEKVDAVDFNNKNFFLWHLYFADVFEKGGFDIVIGNPPYVEAKKLKEIASKLKKYEVYTGTSDLSVYFLEKGVELCKPNGNLYYITTNKFFNTGYGRPVRRFLLKNQISHIVDFEQVEVFEGILVSSVIIGVKKTTEVIDKFTYQKFLKLKKVEFKKQFVSNQTDFGKYNTNFLSEEEWSFANLEAISIKKKIEKSGNKLHLLKGVSVFRGVTTGYNPAFIIDSEKRKELIIADSNNEKIIKPLLQGRNIRKWIYNYNNENLVFSKQGLEIDKYPFIKEYLNEFYLELKPRENENEESGRKPGSYKWFEIQDNTAYYPEFEKSEKIIWGLTADKWAFAYDDKQHYLPSNGYILTSVNIPIKYLLALLNSKVLKFYFGFIGVMTAGGAFTLKHATIQQLPIVLTKNQQPIINLVDYILLLNKLGDNQQVNEFVPNSHIIQLFEEVIDACVYELYFEEDFKNAGISFIEYVERDFHSIEGKSESEAIEIIHAAYQKLRENENEIRNNLKLMDIKLADLIMPIKSMK